MVLSLWATTSHPPMLLRSNQAKHKPERSCHNQLTSVRIITPECARSRASKNPSEELLKLTLETRSRRRASGTFPMTEKMLMDDGVQKTEGERRELHRRVEFGCRTSISHWTKLLDELLPDA